MASQACHCSSGRSRPQLGGRGDEARLPHDDLVERAGRRAERRPSHGVPVERRARAARSAAPVISV